MGLFLLTTLLCALFLLSSILVSLHLRKQRTFKDRAVKKTDRLHDFIFAR